MLCLSGRGGGGGGTMSATVIVNDSRLSLPLISCMAGSQNFHTMNVRLLMF